MALLQILPVTHPKLKQPAAEALFSVGDPEHLRIRQLAADMLQTTKAVGGAGLAAVQVGEMVRLFVMDLAMVGFVTETFINPEIIEASDDLMSKKEGCLSMPDIFFEVERHKWVKVRYLTLEGITKIYDAHGYASVCVQHEIDHLNGIRHIDRLSPLQRERMLNKFKKALKAA